MSRRWNGSAGFDEILVMAPGAVGDGGPITVLAIVNPEAPHFGTLILAENAANGDVFTIIQDTSTYFVAGDFAGYPGALTGVWHVIGYSKASGSATVRWHRYRYDTDVWEHTNGSTVDDGATPPVTRVLFGGTAGRYDGKQAVAGVWASELSDAQVETVGHTSLAQWRDSGPVALWPFNQTVASDPVQDIVGAADETSVIGTAPAVDADEPPGWSYALDITIGPAGGIGSGEAFGTPTVTADPVTIGPAGGIGSGEAFGSPVVSQDAQTLTPTGIPTGEAFGTPTVTADPVTVGPAGGIASGEAFGIPALTLGEYFIGPAGGVGSGEAFGSPVVSQDAQTVVPVGIGSGEAFGTPTLTLAAPQTIFTTGIPSAEAFGVPTLTGGAPVATTCQPWPADMTCLPAGWDANPGLWTARQQFAKTVAEDILNRLTAGIFSLCLQKIRPCRRTCAEQQGWFWTLGRPWMTAPGWFSPALIDGNVVNFGCGCAGSCGCGPICEVALPGPVAEVVSVKVDGLVVPPTNYEIQDGRLLVGLAGQCWPYCQALDQPDTATGTFSVEYLHGTALTPAGMRALTVFMGEVALSCAGEQCALPRRVTEVVREGVTYTLLDNLDFLNDGLTGLPEVDMWIKAVNPYGTRAPMGVWSPDLKPGRRVTWP